MAKRKPSGNRDPVPGSPWLLWAWAPFYIAALAFQHDRIPDGICNDTAEEALRGLYLVKGPKFEVITFAIGNSAETLYLYLLGLMATLLSPTTIAVQITSWIFAIVTIALLIRVCRRLNPNLPSWVPLLLGTSSVWLFHYARSGLRAIAAPVFLLVVWLLLDRAEEVGERRLPAVLCGAALGLSIYAYTSCRILVPAFLVYGAIRIVTGGAARGALTRLYAFVALGAFVVSIPNLVFFIHSPLEFLLRGGYVLQGTFSDKMGHLLWTLLLPFYYPSVYASISGRTFLIDGVSAGLAAAGIRPVHLLVAAAALLGFARAWTGRSKATTLFMLCVWVCGTLMLGITGPSLTRLLILLPVYLALAAMGVAVVLERWPQAHAVVAVSLGAVLLMDARAYFVLLPASLQSSFDFSPAATPIGKRAQELAAAGKRVICVVAKDANVVRYLTYGHEDRVSVAEFYFRPLSAAEIPVRQFAPSTILIERNSRFEPYAAQFPAAWRDTSHERFEEIHLPAP